MKRHVFPLIPIVALFASAPAFAQLKLAPPRVPVSRGVPLAAALPTRLPSPSPDVAGKPTVFQALRLAALGVATGEPGVRLRRSFDLAGAGSGSLGDGVEPDWDFPHDSPATLARSPAEESGPRPAFRVPTPQQKFLEPKPDRLVMRTLVYVNRWLMLTGLPVLNRIPVVRDWPLVRGYFRLRAIDFPPADRERLARAVNRGTAGFLAPNHPEFATDWMLDKEVSSYVAPYMSAWAARDIVRGAPWLWLRNNLIANDGGEAAKEYSIRSALDGKGSLLHPEGAVHWSNDYVHPLFGGIAELAARAALRTDKATYIAPVVWKFRFTDDVSAGLLREMGIVEKALGLPSGEGQGVAARFAALQEGILAGQMRKFGFAAGADGGFFERQEAFRNRLRQDLASRHDGDPLRVARALKTELLGGEPEAARRSRLEADLMVADEIRRLGEFTRAIYGTERLTQEQVYECLKRDRGRLVRGGLSETLARLLPRPVGPRIAHIGVPEPIRVLKTAAAAGKVYEKILLDETRARMQSKLDEINRRIAPLAARYSVLNPLR